MLSNEEAAASLTHRDWSLAPYRLKLSVCAAMATVTPDSPPDLPKHREV